MSSPSLSPKGNSTAMSPNGLLHVLEHSPIAGERGESIVVRVHCQSDASDSLFVRLVIGSKAVHTKVVQLHDVEYGRWQLEAVVPPFEQLQSSSKMVALSVQALSEDNNILDSVNFGYFTYSTHDGRGRRLSTPTARKLPRLQIPDSASLKRRSVNPLPTPSPTVSDRSHYPKTPKKGQWRIKCGTITRTKHSQSDDLYAHAPVLELTTPLHSLCSDWNSAEISAGRRLVRFNSIQDGYKLVVSCETIPQEDFEEADTVISCIYRESTDAYYVTSVDVIYLLERLTKGDFPVEEKNRIRRNLEGLRPTTVSKHKPGFGDFFQRIMNFPDPKPRNIEKDLKVFQWSLLGQALEKILSKYSVYTSGPNTRESTPIITPAPTASPDSCSPELSFPSSDDLSKSEPLPDFLCDVQMDNAHRDLFESRSFPSPGDTHTSSPTSSTYPYPNPRDGDVNSPRERVPWATTDQDFDTSGLAFEHYTTLSAYEESSYDTDAYGYSNYPCSLLSDGALASLNDQYF